MFAEHRRDSFAIMLFALCLLFPLSFLSKVVMSIFNWNPLDSNSSQNMSFWWIDGRTFLYQTLRFVLTVDLITYTFLKFRVLTNRGTGNKVSYNWSFFPFEVRNPKNRINCTYRVQKLRPENVVKSEVYRSKPVTLYSWSAACAGSGTRVKYRR